MVLGVELFGSLTHRLVYQSFEWCEIPPLQLKKLPDKTRELQQASVMCQRLKKETLELESGFRSPTISSSSFNHYCH